MLMVNQLVGFGAFSSGAIDATIVNTANAAGTADSNSYTFSTQSIGTAATGRIIVVTVGNISLSAARTISSLTIGGNSASSVISVSDGPGTDSGYSHAAIYALQVDSGTTADIIVTLSGTALRCAIGVFAIYDANSATATDTASSAADPGNASIDVSAGGVLIGFQVGYPGSAVTWTNLTERFDAFIESSLSNGHYTGASDAFASAQTSLSVTADPASSSNPSSLVLASFR